MRVFNNYRLIGVLISAACCAATAGAQQATPPQKEAAAKVAAQQKAEEERPKLAHAEGLDTFQRAFSACMDARNCSVQ
jgi:hypothetical protein